MANKRTQSLDLMFHLYENKKEYKVILISQYIILNSFEWAVQSLESGVSLKINLKRI